MAKAPVATTSAAREAAHHRSELRFRRLLERLPAGAYTCDADGLITYYNQHAEQLWGRAPRLNDPVDRFCGSFKLFGLDGTPIAHDRCWMALALRDNRPYNGHEIVIERPDGVRVTALAHANPLHDEDGALAGAVNVLVDITERKRHEQALREADRAKNEFLATLAHELRNPLAPIRNVVQILQLQGEKVTNLPWAVDVIDRQLRHLTRLIDDLLDLARITEHRLELRRERVRLADVLRLAVETSRPQIEDAGHMLTIAELPDIELDADPTRLAQVVSNLLNNAAKYTPRGGRIELTAARENGTAIIVVRDNGSGIAPELLPRIFEMFMQGRPPGGGPSEGLGIGLSLAQRLVQLHGGLIEARSDGPGRGAEFTIRLPRATTAAAQRPPQAVPSAPSAARPLRVLVAEDNRAAAASLRALLQLIGHRVRVAHDGAHALQLAHLLQPDVVLLDLGLPSLSGYELARELRAAPWAQGLLLIATSGWGGTDDRQRSRAAGIDHHLVKPVDPAILIDLLDKAQPRPAAAAAAAKASNGHWQHPEHVQVLPLPLEPR